MGDKSDDSTCNLPDALTNLPGDLMSVRDRIMVWFLFEMPPVRVSGGSILGHGSGVIVVLLRDALG